MKCEDLLSAESEKWEIKVAKEWKSTADARVRARKQRKDNLDNKIKDIVKNGKPYTDYTKYYDWLWNWLNNWHKNHKRYVDGLLKACKKLKTDYTSEQEKHEKKEKEQNDYEKLLKQEFENFETKCKVGNLSLEGKSEAEAKKIKKEEEDKCHKMLKTIKAHSNKLWWIRNDMKNACNGLKWRFNSAKSTCGNEKRQRLILTEIAAERDSLVKKKKSEFPKKPAKPPQGRFWEAEDPYEKLEALKPNADPVI